MNVIAPTYFDTLQSKSPIITYMADMSYNQPRQKVGEGLKLESLPDFLRRQGGSEPGSASSLTESKYGRLEIPNSSTEGYFKDDYFVGRWDPKFNRIRYFDEIQSNGPRGRIEPLVRSVAIFNRNVSGQPVDAFDQFGMAETIQATDQQCTNAYVIYFGREEFPSLMIAANWSSRYLVESVHAEAATSLLNALKEKPIDIAVRAARQATCHLLRERGILYFQGAL